MRTIYKGREPNSLTQHRASAHAYYHNYAGTESLRECLLTEQRGLCCYCLSRIPGRSGIKIEHWHCQSRYPGEQLDYSNLLAACTGNEGQPKAFQHCDTRKGDSDLSRNPANPTHRVEDLIRFEPNGRIVSDDPALDAELNDVLNLNYAFLVNNRKAVLKAFLDTIGKAGNLERPALERWLREWTGESNRAALPPFCQVVVYWIRRRLRRA